MLHVFKNALHDYSTVCCIKVLVHIGLGSTGKQ